MGRGGSTGPPHGNARTRLQRPRPRQPHVGCIVDDAVWKPEVFTDMRALYNWGPPVPVVP